MMRNFGPLGPSWKPSGTVLGDPRGRTEKGRRGDGQGTATDLGPWELFFCPKLLLWRDTAESSKSWKTHMIFNDFCLPGPVWRRLRDHLDRLGGVPEPIWVGVPSWSPLGAPLGAHLGHFGFVLGPSEAHLSSPEALLGPYWGHLGPSWDRPRTILGCLGAI